MDLQALSSIDSFTGKCLMITAAICLLAILVAWYTVRSRIQLSQVILGIFSFLLVMILENIFTLLGQELGVPTTGLAEAIYLTLSVVLSRELIRYGVMRFALCDRFSDTDAALGFGLGFGGLYLFTCAAYYFSLYTTVNEFLSAGESFFVSAGTDSQEAYDLLLDVSAQDNWQFILTGVDRAVFLVRELSFSVLVWYGLTQHSMRRCLLLVPLAHFLAMLPDGLYSASVLGNFYVKEALTLVISAGVALVAAQVYNRKEDQVAHFQVEKLRARRRR